MTAIRSGPPSTSLGRVSRLRSTRTDRSRQLGVAFGEQGELVGRLDIFLIGEAGGIGAGEAGVAILGLGLVTHVFAQGPIQADDRDEGETVRLDEVVHLSDV